MNRITTVPVPATTQRTGSPIWRFSKQHESEIVSLAAQCQSNQQQREPLDIVLPDDEAESDSDDDDDFSTSFPAELTTDGTKQVKREFLDRLAEIVCRKKQASFVTCTSIIEEEDQVIIVIARNERWTEEDKVFLNELADLMEMISSRGRHTVGRCYLKVVSPDCVHRIISERPYSCPSQVACQLLSC